MQQLKDITYRHVAKMMASALPIKSQGFGLKVEHYLDTIKRLPQEVKTALKSAYIFSRKVPREERGLVSGHRSSSAQSQD